MENDNLSKLLMAMGAAGELAYVLNTHTDEIEFLGDFNTFCNRTDELPPKSGADFNLIMHGEDLVDRMRDLSTYMKHATDEDRGFDNEFRINDAHGRKFWVHDTARSVIDTATGETHMYGVLRRISEEMGSRKALHRKLRKDSLTGYLKRDTFCDVVTSIIDDKEASLDETDALCVVGIDRLSIYNEAFGAELTNTIIKAVGVHLEKSMRGRAAKICRMGGDRFAIYVPDVTTHDVSVFAAQVLSSLSAAPLITANGPLRVSVSIGSAMLPVEDYTVSDVLTRAESALQIAKDQGRGCHVPYARSAKDQAQYRQWLQTGDDLVIAMNGNRIVLAYQPIVDAKTGDTAMYECLVRMISADGQMVNAGEFIPAVEHLGMSRMIDKYVLKKAVAELSENSQLSFTVNVSAYTVSDAEWLRTLVALLRPAPQVADRLVIEITESIAMRDISEAKEFVETIQSLGARVALDDFGAGYTSFIQIQKLGVDIVKIDKSFVKNASTSKSGATFIKALHDIANSCNIQTIGEGAETLDDGTMLRDEGIDYIQGYAYGFPSIEKTWDITDDITRDLEKPETQKSAKVVNLR